MTQTTKATINLSDLPTGPIRYSMRNDYMFKAVLQKNQKALTGLLSSLLSIPPDSIVSIEILNPIELGKSFEDKDCILDLKIRLNNNRIINIELQLRDLGNWPERSLIYLCRAFDQPKQGEDYINILTTIHISILDFNLPHLTPEFYSEFKLLNTKNHEVYSDKFVLRVLNLKVLEDDSIIKEPVNLYEWALLFKAKTWEDLKMLAEKNEYIADTIVTLHELSDDEKIQMQCEAREKYNWDLTFAIAKGREEGHQIGLQEGAQRTLISQICKKLKKEKEPEVIANELDEDLAMVRRICTTAAKYAPEYNEDAIYDALQNENI